MTTMWSKIILQDMAMVCRALFERPVSHGVATNTKHINRKPVHDFIVVPGTVPV